MWYMCVVASGPVSPPTTPAQSSNPLLLPAGERRLRSLSSPPDTGFQHFSLASAKSASSSPSSVRYSPSQLHFMVASHPVSGCKHKYSGHVSEHTLCLLFSQYKQSLVHFGCVSVTYFIYHIAKIDSIISPFLKSYTLCTIQPT